MDPSRRTPAKSGKRTGIQRGSEVSAIVPWTGVDVFKSPREPLAQEQINGRRNLRLSRYPAADGAGVHPQLPGKPRLATGVERGADAVKRGHAARLFGSARSYITMLPATATFMLNSPGNTTIP